MEDPEGALALWDYRRRVAAIYQEVRNRDNPEEAWQRWKEDRDELFATHPQSPVPAEARPAFEGLDYFPYDPSWRLFGDIVPGSPASIDLAHNDRGTTRFRSFGTGLFERGATRLDITLYWLADYAGGVFLPFRDATSGDTTYRGGRYLLDTAKGADLGHQDSKVILDFNFAYHPSCVHDPRWSCPLAPPGNVLAVPIEAGERFPA